MYSHKEIISLIEIEPTEEEELTMLFKQWDEAERKEFWRRVKEMQEHFHRRRTNKAKLVQSVIGKKFRVHRVLSIPKYVEAS